MILLGVEEAVAHATMRGYDEGYAAGKRDAMKWIPVTKRLPNRDEYLAKWHDGTEYYVRLLVAYKTDIVEYEIGYYDGFKWLTEMPMKKINDVIAWKPFDQLPELPKEEGGRIHELKILPEYFRAVTSGKKTFEIRYNDRGYSVGDGLVLREFEGGEYTDRSVYRKICYIVDDPAYCKEGFVVLGLCHGLREVEE